MSSVTFSWYWLVTGCLLGFAFLLAIALHLQTRATHRPTISNRPDASDLYGWTVNAATLLMLVSVIGRSFARSTYYSAFLLDILFWPLATVWFIAIFLASLTSGSILQLDKRWWARCILAGCCIVFALAGIWWGTIVAQWILDQAIALHVGPLVDNGVVSAKNSIGGRTPLYTVVISGYKYDVPDYAWWRSLRIGQTIEFVRDPAHTLVFAPGRIAWTWFAAVLTVCGTLLWLWTLGFLGLQLTSRGHD
jgi:hypothetical protein